MSNRGGKLGSSRLRIYTRKVIICRVCDRPITEGKTNLHFLRAHPEIYYTEYPGRVKLQTVQEEVP